MFNAMTAAPMETPLFCQYAKDPTASGNTVIVGDVGELPQDHAFPDITPEQFLSFQNMPQAFPFSGTEAWAEPSTSPSTDHMANPMQVPMSMGPQLPNKHVNAMRGFPGSMRSLESRWLESLESQLPTNMTPASMPTVPQDSSLLPESKEPEGFQYKSESSSVSGEYPGAYEGSHSATSDEPSAFPERKLNEDDPWSDAQKDEASEVPQPFQNTTAFMVSEAPSEQFFGSGPSRSRASSNAAQRANARPQALALQSAATVKKRKQRSSNHSLDGLPKPLQIVQEDGQGGSVASADFVSPPRGARRKGPLSMVGRANAGLRRKNKDTCVQCRLNKRKVGV